MFSRKEAKESSAAACRNVSTSDTVMFGRDDLRLPDMLTSIPEGILVYITVSNLNHSEG